MLLVRWSNSTDRNSVPDEAANTSHEEHRKARSKGRRIVALVGNGIPISFILFLVCQANPSGMRVHCIPLGPGDDSACQHMYHEHGASLNGFLSSQTFFEHI